MRVASRISTQQGPRSCRGGGAHTYAGIGGTHYHSGWTIDFEASPLVAYVYAHVMHTGEPAPLVHDAVWCVCVCGGYWWC